MRDQFNLLVESANNHLSANQFGEAKIILEKIIQLYPHYEIEEAYYWLGILYERGRGTEQDYEKAYQYYMKAADLKYAPAMERIAFYNMYEAIDNPSFEKASALYEIFAGTGDDSFKYMAGLCKILNGDSRVTKYENDKNWEIGRKYLAKSNDKRAKALLRYTNHKILDSCEPKMLELHELYRMLKGDEKKAAYVYRGQTRAYDKPLCPSFYRPCRYSRFGMEGEYARQIKKWGKEFYLMTNNINSLGTGKQAYKVKRFMSMYLNNAFGYPLTQGLFQQAGYSSEGLDVSYDLCIALFFALYEYKEGHYYLKDSNEPSILYRWKVPDNKVTLYDNYFCGSYFLPTYDILNGFGKCDTIEESVHSIQRYLKAINWGNAQFDLPERRPFELIKLPEAAFNKGRISLQKGALLFPDKIPGYLEQQTQIRRGWQEGELSDLDLNLVQDLSDASICDIFLIDCKNLKKEIKLLEKLPAPDDIYSDNQQDITHMFTKNVFETAYKEYVEGAAPVMNSLRMYGLNYYDVLNQLKEWNEKNEGYQYFFC